MALFTQIGNLYRKIREGVLVMLLALVLGVLAVLGWQWGRQGIVQQIYRDRLEAMHHEYTALQARYESLVRKTAITELEVDETGIAVVVRSDVGELTRLATNLNPAHEIYVDYVVLDGRLWIRRVFDSSMSPEEATYVDPSLAGIPWSEHSESDHYGKAVYRHLTPGRWVVTTTGNGALGIARLDEDARIQVQSPGFPMVEDDWEASVEVSIEDIGWKDAAQWVLSQRPW